MNGLTCQIPWSWSDKYDVGAGILDSLQVSESLSHLACPDWTTRKGVMRIQIYPCGRTAEDLQALYTQTTVDYGVHIHCKWHKNSNW